MHKSKKKSKSTELPKPIKVKKEKTEEDRTLHSMDHYIDDRLELVKQIFGSLKPKTITNLAPEFLKKKAMEEIEEMCLNELLCISTKRLHSIINGTQCPTDTESSSDSDVQHEPDHVSLEEISSDSEIDGGGRSSNASKRKLNGKTAKKHEKTTDENNKETKAPEGQISVLELLELQARARAIRSQLALEPVTKIEVNSDDEAQKTASAKESAKQPAKTTREHKKQPEERKRKSSMPEKSAPIVSSASKQSKPTTVPASSTVAATPPPQQLSSRKIKLKRNYRSNNQDREDAIKSPKEIKQESKLSRSQSPDVIPIVAEPETLLISDSSDLETSEEAQRKSVMQQNKTAAEVIACVAVPPSTSPETPVVEKTDKQPNRRERCLTETEEGELTESDEDSTAENDEGGKELSTGVEQNIVNAVTEKYVDLEKSSVSETSKGETHDSDSNNLSAENSANTNDVRVTTESCESSTATSSSKEISKITDAKESTSSAINLDEYDDQNDDVISIEGGDLESEMIEHLAEGTSSAKIAFVSMKHEDVEDEALSVQTQDTREDIISLNSSGDETEKMNTESWHSRYLRSSKVSKVLAASRLGARVRDKIKKSKHNKKDQKRDTDIEEEKFQSKHEDGSVEQYKELLEMRQRKT